MINIAIRKFGTTDENTKSRVYGALRNLLPLLSALNKEITVLNKICGANIKFSIKIGDSLVLEVQDV